MNATVLPATKTRRFPLVHVFAWGLLLALSLLPDVLWKTLAGSPPAWLFAAKLACGVALLAASLVWQTFKPLRSFFLVALVVFTLVWAAPQIYAALGLQSWISGAHPFVKEMLTVQTPRFTVGILVAVLLWVLTRRGRGHFFLTMGKLDTPAAPIPWLMTRPTSWRILGPFLSLALTAGLVVFMLLFGSRPSGEQLVGALPLLPLVLLFAAANAFGEEMIYRASFLTTLEGVIGPAQALFSTALFFGLEHYYGVPYGVLGVAMSALVGWFMGKAMLETRGFFWAWLIHFCMDVAVFIFIAMGSITPGG